MMTSDMFVTEGVKRLNKILDLVRKEFIWASQRFGSFNTLHEGKAVIEEEFDELWTEIKRKNNDNLKILKEAVQVAAMAVRLIYDCCPTLSMVDKLSENRISPHTEARK